MFSHMLVEKRLLSLDLFRPLKHRRGGGGGGGVQRTKC